MASYPEPRAGEWVKPKRRFYYMQCCDCGLVHKMEFAVQKDGRGAAPIFRVWRDNLRTAAVRRWRKIKVKKKY